MAETSTKNINNSFTVSDQDGRAATRKWIHVDTLDDLVHCFPSSGDHSFSQTDAVRREQEGNGGLDRRSQVRPEVGNLRGEQLVSSFIHPAPDAVIQNLVFDPFLFSPPLLRPASSTWSTSPGCTTGTPARTPDPPSATSAGRPCQASPPTASPAKVHALARASTR